MNNPMPLICDDGSHEFFMDGDPFCGSKHVTFVLLCMICSYQEAIWVPYVDMFNFLQTQDNSLRRLL